METNQSITVEIRCNKLADVHASSQNGPALVNRFYSTIIRGHMLQDWLCRNRRFGIRDFTTSSVFSRSFAYWLKFIKHFRFSAPRFWGKIKYHFFLKMYQIWHMSFCMAILTRKFNKIFLLKFSYRNSCVKFKYFI